MNGYFTLASPRLLCYHHKLAMCAEQVVTQNLAMALAVYDGEQADEPKRGCWLCGNADAIRGCDCGICKGELLCNHCYCTAMEHADDPLSPRFNGKARLMRLIHKFPKLVSDPKHPLRLTVEVWLKEWLLHVDLRKRQKDVS